MLICEQELPVLAASPKTCASAHIQESLPGKRYFSTSGIFFFFLKGYVLKDASF